MEDHLKESWEQYFETLGLEQVRAKIATPQMEPAMLMAAMAWVDRKAKERDAMAWRTETAAWIGAVFGAMGFILALLVYLKVL